MNNNKNSYNKSKTNKQPRGKKEKVIYNNPDEKVDDKIAYLLIIDKFNKRFLAITADNQSFGIPGDFGKIFETFPETAIRAMLEKVGLRVHKQKLTKMLDANDADIQVITYVSTTFSGQIHEHCKKHVKWVPFECLKYNKIEKMCIYNTMLYEKILGGFY